MSIAIRYYSMTGNTKKLAEAEGIPMADEEFHCRGAFSVMHKGRPNAKDLADVKVFVKKLIKD